MSGRKLSLKPPAVVDVGCGCRRTKLYSLFSHIAPTKPKLNPHTSPKHHHHHHHSLSPSTNFSTSSTTHNLSFSSSSSYSSFSPSSTTVKKPSPPVPVRKSFTTTTTTTGCKPAKTKGRVAKESVAVVKESEDPYRDFRDSMMQMILEKEIYAWDDLKELLHRFLSLNSPYHHDCILRAFTEIWNDVFSCSGGGGAPAGRKHEYHHQRQRERQRMGRA